MQVHCVSLKHLAKEARMPVAENFENCFALQKPTSAKGISYFQQTTENIRNRAARTGGQTFIKSQETQ
jgi:hypothetical protein